MTFRIPKRGACDRSSSSPWRSGAVAAVLYLGFALWIMRDVLPAPSQLLPFRTTLTNPAVRGMDRGDQLQVVWAIARGARAFATGSWDLFRGGQCYPMASSVTLGDHMLGAGLLGAAPYWATHDPIFTYNAVVVLTLWIPALAMYALAYYWTANPAAAFVAGFLFGFDPWRVTDCSHPSVHGNLWTPLVLLFTHRVFVRRGWVDALALAAFLGLQVLESFYQILACAVVGGLYGGWVLVRHRRALPALLAKLALVATIVASITTIVLGPYLHTRATWDLLAGRQLQLYHLSDFGLRGVAYPGTLVLSLALVAILDRLRGPRPRHGDDPRLVLLAGGLLLLWCVLSEVRLPFVALTIVSPLTVVRHFVPGIEAVRALGTLRYGVDLVAAFLAAYGVVVLAGQRRAIMRHAARALIVGAVSAEILWLPFARWSFVEPAALSAYLARPPAEVVQLSGRAGEGAVLDLPFHFDLRGQLVLMPFYVFLGGYHLRPTAACYDSFPSPLGPDIETLAGRLPDPAAADALYALGFRTILVHTNLLAGAERATLDLEQPALAGRVRLEERAGTLLRYGLASPVPVRADFAALAADATPTGGAVELASPRGTVDFTFRNASDATYRHPAPIQPMPLVARWQRASGETVGEDAVRALLPLALAPHEALVRSLVLPVPNLPGDYTVSLTLAAAPRVTVATRAVRVVRGQSE